MEQAQKAYFWRAPMTYEGRANLIILWAGGVFVALGVVCCLAALGALSSLAPERVASDGAAALLLLGPGAALVLFKSRVAAGVLLALSTLSAALSVVLVLVVIASNQPEHLGFLTLVTLFWGTLAVLTWHALRATVALRATRMHAPAAIAATIAASK
jgi:hypothetical protein